MTQPKLTQTTTSLIQRAVPRPTPLTGLACVNSPYRVLKRLLDIALSLIAIISLLPFTAICLLAIIVGDPHGGSPIFKQRRIGINSVVFVLYKFRTMRKNAPNACPTWRLQNADQYITKVGRFLRKTSLDEIPQLWNILKGDMSFIGPRPLVPAEEEIHELRCRRNVYSVRPGITGLAQISGRDNLAPEDKVKYDAIYVERMSLKFDSMLLARTLYYVMRCKDIVEGELEDFRRIPDYKSTCKKGAEAQ